jgi:hypothetical protein
MGRLLVAGALLASVGLVPGALRLPVGLVGSVAAAFTYREHIGRILARFAGIWLAFFAAVGAGRAWAGTGWEVLATDGAASLGLALGVAAAMLVIVTGPPHVLLRALDRLHIPRSATYTVLAVLRLLPQMASLGKRQLALLRLKGIGAGGPVQRMRAYPRVVAPLFALLLHQQLIHTRSLVVRGFFTRIPPGPRSDSEGAGAWRWNSPGKPALLEARDFWLALLVLAHTMGWIGVSLWLR